MVCKYHTLGCNVTCTDASVLKLHEENLEFHMDKISRNAALIASKNSILQAHNDRLLKLCTDRNLLANVSKKRKLSVQRVVLPSSLNESTEYTYPIKFRFDSSQFPVVTVDAVKAFGQNVPTELVDDAVKEHARQTWAPVVVPEALTSKKSLLIFGLQSDVPFSDDILCKTHVCLMPRNQYLPAQNALVNTHFVLSDCMQFSSIEDAMDAATSMVNHMGVFSYLGLCIQPDKKSALLVVMFGKRSRHIWTFDDRVVHLCVIHQNQYDSSAPILIGGREYSKPSTFCAREYGWTQDGRGGCHSLILGDEFMISNNLKRIRVKRRSKNSQKQLGL